MCDLPHLEDNRSLRIAVDLDSIDRSVVFVALIRENKIALPSQQHILELPFSDMCSEHANRDMIGLNADYMYMPVPQHYVPKSLSKRDVAKQKRELRKSRRMYRRGKYHTRKKVKSYKSRRSNYAKDVERIYGISSKKISLNKLAKKTRCTRKALDRIVRKGIGAYYSSGSRPNQTGHSWGYARLFSAVTGGPASKVDRHILEEGCRKNSKALKLAKRPRPNTRRRRVKI